MSIADKLSEVAKNVQKVFEAGESKHKMRYATAFVTGDGTNTVSWDCPFEPDVMYVTVNGAEGNFTPKSILFMTFDFRAFARYGGHYRFLDAAGTRMQGNMSSGSGRNYFKYANGKCEVTLPVTQSTEAYYNENSRYVCAAVKYTDKSDGELLCEEIAQLADTGEVLQYSKARINATVSDAEWQTLIANKPNRTFTLV